MKKSTRWPLGIGLFYGAFVLALVLFAVFSTRHRMDLVTRDYYGEQLRYQQQIDRSQRANALETPVRLDYDRKSGLITIIFPAEMDPLAVEGEIHFFRPSDASLDRHIPLHLSPEHRQVIPVHNLAKGYWKVKLTWKVNGVEYYHEEAVMIE